MQFFAVVGRSGAARDDGFPSCATHSSDPPRCREQLRAAEALIGAEVSFRELLRAARCWLLHVPLLGLRFSAGFTFYSLGLPTYKQNTKLI